MTQYNISLNLTGPDAEMVARAIAELPFRVALPIIQSMQNQINEQNAAEKTDAPDADALDNAA